MLFAALLYGQRRLLGAALGLRGPSIFLAVFIKYMIFMNSIQKFQCSGYNFVIFSDHYCFDIGSWEKGKIITIYAKYYVAIQEQMLE